MRVRPPSFDMRYLVAGATVVAAAGGAYGLVRYITNRRLPSSIPPPAEVAGIPFASLPGAVWPLVTDHSKAGSTSYRDVDGNDHERWAREFGAPRDGRHHAGVDLFAYAGDPVVAMKSGTVVATQSFHLGSDAILVEHGDVVVLYGEVAPDSWKEFGVEVGSKVSKGEPIARVACMQSDGKVCTSHMLHLEMYTAGTTKNAKWYGTPPPNLLNPTKALLLT